MMHEKFAKFQESSAKASKADRGAHYIEKKKSKKAQLHESG